MRPPERFGFLSDEEAEEEPSGVGDLPDESEDRGETEQYLERTRDVHPRRRVRVHDPRPEGKPPWSQAGDGEPPTENCLANPGRYLNDPTTIQIAPKRTRSPLLCAAAFRTNRPSTSSRACPRRAVMSAGGPGRGRLSPRSCACSGRTDTDPHLARALPVAFPARGEFPPRKSPVTRAPGNHYLHR